MRAEQIAPVFFALGEPTRLVIVRRLQSRGELSATALASGASVTRQAISKHLQVMQDAGLVSAERRGREVFYSLEPERLDQARGYLDDVSAGWDRALDRLRAMVEAPRGAKGRR